jgi:hypothetical protein
MSPDKIEFENWVPLDAQAIISLVVQLSIADDPSFEAQKEMVKVFERLATRLEMKDAWAELKHFPNVTPSDLIIMTWVVWLSATLYRRLGLPPNFKSTRKRELASMTREVTRELRTTNPATLAEAGITETTLKELERVTAFLQQQAGVFDLLLRISAPPKKALARNADQVVFVYGMGDWLNRQTGRRRPYMLLAILANVIFNVSTDSLWNADRVKHCLRVSPRRLGQVWEHFSQKDSAMFTDSANDLP